MHCCCSIHCVRFGRVRERQCRRDSAPRRCCWPTALRYAVLQGDLGDPNYFDFISFAQYGV